MTADAPRDPKAELDRYFDMIDKRMPDKMSNTLAWLRKPSSGPARATAGGFLILGGVFSFLPVLGVWMLPLGLMIIAQDVPALQKPLASTFGWIEKRFTKNK